MTTAHGFRSSLGRGKNGERALDAYWQKWNSIEMATPGQERAGIDRLFKNNKTGMVFTVEYKTDERAASTGNAFIELISDRDAGSPGWAVKSMAQVLCYYTPPDPKCYWTSMLSIKCETPAWERKYPKREVLNREDGREWVTVGILVPLFEIEKLSRRVDISRLSERGA